MSAVPVQACGRDRLRAVSGQGARKATRDMMAACEKCWRDAHMAVMLRGGSVSDRYRELLEERKDNPCSKAEQDGKTDECV